MTHYMLFPVACVYGDPHMVTLDGYKYTFNGKGEFTLVKHEDDMFTLQARMTEIENSNGTQAGATVFSAIAAKQYDSDVVEFRQSRRGLDALVNGVMVDFEDLPKQDYGNVTLSNLGNETLSALFSCGAYIQAKVENGIISVLLVSLPDSFYNATYGLMGVFNKDMTDDLMIKNSTQYLPLNSSNEDIHWQFGLSCKPFLMINNYAMCYHKCMDMFCCIVHTRMYYVYINAIIILVWSQKLCSVCSSIHN